MLTKQIILASASPRRKLLFEELNLDFIIEPSSYAEDMTLDLSPSELVKHLALGKAKDVAAKHQNSLVIGADTIVVLNGKIYGKPKDRQDAIQILSELNGTKHSVFTGFAIIDTDTKKTTTGAVESFVYFKNNTLEEIEKYVDTDLPFDKAGAYAIQDPHFNLLEKTEADRDNIIGLPLKELSQSLKEFYGQ